MEIERHNPFGPDVRPEAKATAENSSERPVLVNGRYLGREFQEFSLQSIWPSQLGSGAVRELYLETSSGNLYHIYPSGENNLAIVDARTNRGRGNQMTGSIVSEAEAKSIFLRIGQPFKFGKGALTSEVVRIIGVTGKQFVTSAPDPKVLQEIARRETNGNVSDIQERFEAQVRPDGA